MDGNDFEPVLRDEWLEEFLTERRLSSVVPIADGVRSRDQVLKAKQTLLRVRDMLDRELERLDQLLLRPEPS